MLPLISGGFLNVTQSCNLKCEYCFVHQQPLQMSYQVAKDAAIFYADNALKSRTTPQITFFGGEPMLRWDDVVKPLIQFIRETYGEFDLSITTNGTLLDEEKVKFLKDNDVGLLLSIDGDKDTQDSIRPYHSGKGSYDDIDVDMVLRYYPNITFRGTIDPKTVHNMYENYLWAEQKGYTNAAMILNVFADWDGESMDILIDQVERITRHIIDKMRAGLPYVTFNQSEEMDRKLRLLETIQEGYFRDDGQGCAACGRCGLGATRFASVGASGNIYSCQELTEGPDSDNFVIGNIYTGVSDEKRLQIANSFNTRNVKSSKEGRCETCRLNPVCDGGCTINNYFKTGFLDVMPESFCIYQEEMLKMREKIKGEYNV